MGMLFNCIGEPIFSYFYTAYILGAPAQAAEKLAKEGIASRSVIHELRRENSRLQNDNYRLRSRVERLTDQLMEMKELCKPYLEALERFPEKVKEFFKSLTPKKEKSLSERQKTQSVPSHEHAKPKKKQSRDLSR